MPIFRNFSGFYNFCNNRIIRSVLLVGNRKRLLAGKEQKMFRKSIIGIAGILVLISALAVNAEDAPKKTKAPSAKQVRPGQQKLDKWLNELTKAYQDKDSEKVGQLIRQMRQNRKQMRARTGQQGGGKVAVGRKARPQAGRVKGEANLAGKGKGLGRQAGKGKAGIGGQRRQGGQAAGKRIGKGLSHERITERLEKRADAKSQGYNRSPKAMSRMQRGEGRGRGKDFGERGISPRRGRQGSGKALGRRTRRGRQGGGKALGRRTRRGRQGSGEAMGRGQRRGMRGGRGGKMKAAGRRGKCPCWGKAVQGRRMQGKGRNNWDRDKRGDGGRGFFRQGRGRGEGRRFQGDIDRPATHREFRGHEQRRRGDFDNRNRGSERRQMRGRRNRFEDESDGDFDWGLN